MWKRAGCLRRKIEYRKDTAQIEMAIGIFCIFIVTIVLFVGLKIAQFMITGAYVEDALAASNLASALIDIEEFGKSGEIRISDPVAAYGGYKEALSQNLMLKENGSSLQKELLEGVVQIQEYIIYNVDRESVQIISFSEEEQPCVKTGILGESFTPDGVKVETTTIYSRVQFQVKGIGNMYIKAVKHKSIDIKRVENNE